VRWQIKPYWVLAVICVSLAPAFAQENGAPLPKPAPPAAPPPETGKGAVTEKEVVNYNTAIVAARTATKEERHADAEALMLCRTEEVGRGFSSFISRDVDLPEQVGSRVFTPADRST
jgi:hypothetical protein